MREKELKIFESSRRWVRRNQKERNKTKRELTDERVQPSEVAMDPYDHRAETREMQFQIDSRSCLDDEHQNDDQGHGRIWKEKKRKGKGGSTDASKLEVRWTEIQRPKDWLHSRTVLGYSLPP